MMESLNKHENILNEVLRGRITLDDPRFLEWLEASEENRQRYEDEISQMAKEVLFEQELDTRSLWRKVDERIKLHENKRKDYRIRVLRYAATILLPLLVVGGYFFTGKMADKILVESVREVHITPGSKVARLILSGGEEINLSQGDSSLLEVNGTQIALQEEGKIVYETRDTRENEVLFNTIQVPVKGEYSITLSDGTKVWLAAASQLRYPVNFTGDKREIYLEGEAFFDVAPNKEKPFIVNCGDFSVKALGTSFNVMNYPDELTAQATLSTGKVEVTMNNNAKQILVPGQQAVISEGKMSVREVNLVPYTSWMQDRFYFSNEELQVIMRKVTRWYGIEIKYTNPEIMEYHFTGNIPKYSEIDKVFELLELTTPVSFQIQNNTVIISERNLE